MKKTDIRELNINQLGKVNGGWEYDGNVEWLKGYNIKCPYCDADDEETIYYAGRTKMFIGFGCRNCKVQFNYAQFNGKIYVSTWG